MESAMCELVIKGVPVNIESQLEILGDPAFRAGTYTTDFMKNR